MPAPRLAKPKIAPPGPKSRALLARLAKVESPNVTCLEGAICWQRAAGTRVWDADGTEYLDMTAAFAVAALGHTHPAIIEAIWTQSEVLIHGMGDVHPAGIKVALLERLAELAPDDLSVSILGCTGSDAIEAALKTALLTTAKPGIIAFSGAYHGLSYGTVALSGRDVFRAPFASQLNPAVRCAPYPDPYRPAQAGLSDADLIAYTLERMEAAAASLALAETPAGCVVVEPIQGRGGEVVPPEGFLTALREYCTAHELLLIADEIYTGIGRTGAWFACDHEHVVPDLMCLGKGLTSGFPLSVCIGTPEAMRGWPKSRGEALHTSTYLGHPLGCAMALASLEVIEEEGLVEHAQELGAWLGEQLRSLTADHPHIGEVRGRGLMWGLDCVTDRGSKAPDGDLCKQLVSELLARGIITLPSGSAGHVLGLSPPLIIQQDECALFLEQLKAVLQACH